MGLVGKSAELFTLCAVAGYFVRHVRSIDFYARLSTAWQLTLWSMHAAPIIAMRLVLRTRAARAGGMCWMVASCALRRCRVSEPWSLSFVVIEGAALAMPLTSWLLGALLLLQVVIVVGFWAGMFAAACSDKFSFLPLDRHLHRGLRHMLTSAEAQRRLLHDLTGHGFQQALFARHILRAGPALWPPGLAQARDAAALVAAYALIVLAFAALLPPHRLPYVNIDIRRACLQRC